VGRYHSLVISPATLPPELAATAWTDDGVLMAVAHRTRPVFGVQFHPESILTDGGFPLLANFLRLAGVPHHAPLPDSASERPPPRISKPLPQTPVTF
jgi:anthranilate synthase component 2